MAIDTETVRRIAHLARIDVPEAELQPLAQDLDRILGWVEALGEVDTDGVAPVTSVVDRTLGMRDDVVTDGACAEKILANAPDRVGDFFAVPKVVE